VNVGTWLSRIPIWNLVKLKVKKFIQLDDVSISSPSDDDIVYWHNASSKFKAKAFAGGGGVVGEGHIFILPAFYNTIPQGAWYFLVNTSYWLEGSFRNSSSNDGDSLTYKLYLDAGTYTLGLLTNTGSAKPIVDIDIDAVEVASFDLYSSPAGMNTILKQTGIVIASAGLKTLTYRIDGKNASSSNYNAKWQAIALWRTA